MKIINLYLSSKMMEIIDFYANGFLFTSRSELFRTAIREFLLEPKSINLLFDKTILKQIAWQKYITESKNIVCVYLPDPIVESVDTICENLKEYKNISRSTVCSFILSHFATKEGEIQRRLRKENFENLKPTK